MAIIEIQPPEIMVQDPVAILTLDKTGMEVLYYFHAGCSNWDIGTSGWFPDPER